MQEHDIRHAGYLSFATFFPPLHMKLLPLHLFFFFFPPTDAQHGCYEFSRNSRNDVCVVGTGGHERERKRRDDAWQTAVRRSSVLPLE